MRHPLPPLRSLTLGEANAKETCHLEEYLTRDYDNVAQAAEELPAVMSWLNYHFAIACQKTDIAKRQLKETEATVYFELRGGTYEAQGFGDKKTEKSLDRAVCLNESVKKAARIHEYQSKICEQIRGQVIALQVKLDLIRTTEATRRRIHEAPVSDEVVAGAPETEEEQQNEN